MLSVKVGDALIDTDKSTAIGFKFTSGWVDGIQANGKYRTFDFSVPATANNNRIFLHTNNTAFDGLRQHMEAAIGDGGVWLEGTLYLRSSDKERHNLLFVHGRNALGLDITKPSGVFADTISVRDKMAMQLGGTIPDFGFYGYNNGNGDTQAVTMPLDHMPCLNFGYWLRLMAAAAGYHIVFPAGSGWYSPFAYGLILPTANTYTDDTLTITGSGRGGWTYTVGSGGTLADIGLNLVTKRYKRGQFNENVTVYVFQALRHLTIVPDGTGTKYTYAGGEGYDVLCGGSSIHDPYAEEFEMNAGDWFTVADPDDTSHPFASWKWGGSLFQRPGYETPLTTTFTIKDDESVVENGETLNLADNLPDLSLEDGLNAFCNIICGTYTVDTTAMTITVTTLSAAMAGMSVGIDLNSERVTKIGEVKPYIEGWAQHNIVRCDSADYVRDGCRFRRDYPCVNDYLEEEAELGEIPFNEGNHYMHEIGGNSYRCAFFEDITQGDDGTNDYKGDLSIICEAPANVPALHLNTTTDDGVGLDYADFTRDAITLEVSAALPLYKFLQLYTGTLVHFGSRDWVIRSANWSGGIVNMTLLSYT